MADIVIVNRKGKCESELYINEEFEHLVYSFSITWDCIDGLPILRVDRRKPGEDGKPYTIGGGFVADLTEYYPVHSLKVLNRD